MEETPVTGLVDVSAGAAVMGTGLAVEVAAGEVFQGAGTETREFFALGVDGPDEG